MRLADFILSNIEEISQEWERFAATLLPDEKFSQSILRDGIAEILKEIACDMKASQNAEQQQEKSEGEYSSTGEGTDNVAEKHALERVRMGLSSAQLISEFRALRATVIRLWIQSEPKPEKVDLYDITRFNEAIDQVLTDTTRKFSEKIEQSRDLFLGILGHDLRSPVGAILGLAELLPRAKNSEQTAAFSVQIITSATRISHMITDLIELTRVQLGTGIAINPTDASMRKMCLQVLEEMKVLHPEKVFRLNTEGNLEGKWDHQRMIQVLSNLFGNAVQHGASDSVITVTAAKRKDKVEVRVHNEGSYVEPEMRKKIFDRFIQGQAGKTHLDEEDPSTSLGLGLYIAKEIVVAHGGTIEVDSSRKMGTTFKISLPEITTKTLSVQNNKQP